MSQAASPKLELRQGQSLVMTQQLQQSIKLLQLSSIELAEYIEQELEKNPLLTVEEASELPAESDSEDKSDDEGADEIAEGVDGNEESSDILLSQNGESNEWNSEDAGDDESNDSNYSDLHYTGMRVNSDDDDDMSPERNITKAISLKEHLLEQLHVEIEDPMQRMIGLHLIDMLDDSGYVQDELKQVASLLSCDLILVEETLKLLQQFDPVGVFARNLQECITLQLKEKDRFDPAMQKLVEHLDLLAKGELGTLCKVCAVDHEDLRQMISEIKALNPRPASGFMVNDVQTVVPDIFLKRTKNNGWQVELNNSVLPRVLVNRQYHAQLTGKTRDKMEKKYLSDQMMSANWLIKALDQRANTILKVTTEIVKRQDGFFRNGIRYLKPLTLKDVADEVELHESTVSRVTSNKYLSTHRGTYELKYFFTSTIQNSNGGEDYSSRTVMHLIKELVDKEIPSDILSDDTISSILKERGIECARRTVTKYREEMGIGSSVQRRREKKVSV
jgi:RNA polymerase sigma-54 factor